MISNISNLIPLIIQNNCFCECKDEHTGVYDDEKLWCKLDQGTYNFRISNPGRKTFWFLAIDKCCLDNTHPKRRCDFGLILENEHFYLIEIKDKEPKDWKKYDPIDQLEQTIQHFESLSVFNGYKKKTSIICFRYKPELTVTNSSENTARLRFLRKYKFLLMEGNHIEIK